MPRSQVGGGAVRGAEAEQQLLGPQPSLRHPWEYAMEGSNTAEVASTQQEAIAKMGRWHGE